MLPNKSTNVLSELQNFFTSGEKACNSIFLILQNMKIFNAPIPSSDISRTVYSRADLAFLLILFPLIHIRNVCDYCKSPVYSLFNSGKDTFYRLKNNPLFDWRAFGYFFTMKLVRKAEQQGESSGITPRCLILDDTDLPKTGRKMELIGRVWSHVQMRSIIGFKGLFLGYHDGKSFYGLDFSLHGEKGKNKKFPYGMSPDALNSRYSKARDQQSPGANRVQEYLRTKTEMGLELVRRAISRGIRFDYMLVDSWFVNERLIRFVRSRRIGCHLLGMIKMGGTKYNLEGKTLTATEIAEKLRRAKKLRKSRVLHVWYATQTVNYKGSEVKLFFCKNSVRGKWNVLLSTNTDLTFEEAYRIYSIRWSIEVFFYGKHILMQSNRIFRLAAA